MLYDNMYKRKEMIKLKLSDIVKNYRMQNGLTQDDIARLAKCSKAYICMIENGKDSKTGKPINPSITFLHNLATAMNMTSEELYKLLDIDISIRVNEEGLSINESPEEYGSKRPDEKIDIYKELQGATVLFNGYEYEMDEDKRKKIASYVKFALSDEDGEK